MAFTSRITLLAALAVAAFQAQAVNVTVAYQTSAEPAKVAQADNTFAKTSGATVDWRKFDSGASVVRALASGDVQIGNIGSEHRTAYFYIDMDGAIFVRAGCWFSGIEDFKVRVKYVRSGTIYETQYMAACAYAETVLPQMLKESNAARKEDNTNDND